ncbi:DUF6318 family protein [Pseudarthrobacter sp. NPDC092419]|uniref:DUF6318 family protein n=1 Tax=Pseudarthrobacter sp. NPDC092419 TaxID=3364414 RepID=UPI00380FA41F
MASHVISKPAFLGRIAVVAGAALLLGGCAGAAPEPAASPDTTQSGTTSVSVSPTATATAMPAYKPASAKGPAQNVPLPVLPAVAKTETKEGLEAFTKYWFAVLSYAYETGDVELLKGVSGPDCAFCNGLVKNVSNAWKDDKWISGGRVKTPAVTGRALENEPWQATVQVMQDEISIHNPDGTLTQDPTKAINVGSQVVATFGRDGWTVTELGLIR